MTQRADLNAPNKRPAGTACVFHHTVLTGKWVCVVPPITDLFFFICKFFCSDPCRERRPASPNPLWPRSVKTQREKLLRFLRGLWRWERRRWGVSVCFYTFKRISVTISVQQESSESRFPSTGKSLMAQFHVFCRWMLWFLPQVTTMGSPSCPQLCRLLVVTGYVSTNTCFLLDWSNLLWQWWGSSMAWVLSILWPRCRLAGPPGYLKVKYSFTILRSYFF